MQLLGVIAYYQSLSLEFTGKRPKIDDFVIDYWATPKEQTKEELRINLKASLGV